MLSNAEVSLLIYDLSLCSVTASSLRSLLPDIRHFLLTVDRCDASLCLAVGNIVNMYPDSASVFVGQQLLNKVTLPMPFIGSVARASTAGRAELLDESSIVEVALDVLGRGNRDSYEALEVLEALSIEPQGKRQIAKSGVGVLAHLAATSEASDEDVASGRFRSTLYGLIRSLSELPEFLFKFVEVLQSEGRLLREIFGNLALKPLNQLLPGTLALEAVYQILSQPGNPVMLAHFVCPKKAWREPREFVKGECMGMVETLRACGDVDLAKKCLEIIM